MVYVQPRICRGEWDTKTPMGFWHTNGSPNPGQTTIPSDSQQLQKKKNFARVVNLAFLVGPRSKIESEKKDKYQDLARELKKL